jgi:RHS repeat-associated protein
VITDVLGGNAGTRSYDPYGTQTVQTGNWNDAFGTPYATLGWAGEYKDTDTGFTYLRARHYDPATGQFLQNDPVSGGSCNTHEYGCANPLTNTDPTGAKCEIGLNPLRWASNAKDCAVQMTSVGATGGACIDLSGGMPLVPGLPIGIGGGAVGCAVLDTNGDVGLTGSVSGGPGIGTPGASLTFGPMLSASPRVEDLGGTADGLSVSGGNGFALAGSVSQSKACGVPYVSAYGGMGLGGGAWVGLERSRTWVASTGPEGCPAPRLPWSTPWALPTAWGC